MTWWKFPCAAYDVYPDHETLTNMMDEDEYNAKMRKEHEECYKENHVKPIIGQEAICPDGLGRVVEFEDNFPRQWIRISTYVNDRQCKWDFCNVELIDPRR
mgnify:CR=1 FL=1